MTATVSHSPASLRDYITDVSNAARAFAEALFAAQGRQFVTQEVCATSAVSERDLAKGRRPSWSAAAPGPVAEPLVGAVVQALRDLGARVQTGVFGADMTVSLINDGPVTIIVDL